MPPREMTQVLSSYGFHALGVDLGDAWQIEVTVHEQVATAKSEENRIFAGALRGFMVGAEGQGESREIRHGSRLPDLADYHRGPRMSRALIRSLRSVG